jgi:hypothetical protein
VEQWQDEAAPDTLADQTAEYNEWYDKKAEREESRALILSYGEKP